jgi:arylformamidase
MKFIDVSVPLDEHLPSYPGNAPLEIEPVKRLARGDSSNVSTLRLSAHAGTHVDSARHFFDTAGGIEALSLDLLCGRARVIEVSSTRAITAEDLQEKELAGETRVLIKTSNSRLWGDPTFHTNYIGVGESAARYLVEQGVTVVGVDYLSVEPFKTPNAPTHHILLGAGTIVIEGLNLRDVAPGVYEMFCLPLNVVGADGAPARVVLRQA